MLATPAIAEPAQEDPNARPPAALAQDDGSRAQKNSDARPTRPATIPYDEWAVGAALIVVPRYPGASSYQALPVPMLHYENKSGFFASPVDGVGFKADTGRFAAGLSLRYDFSSRASDDDSRFSQWNSIDGAAAARLFGEYRAGAYRFKISHDQRLTREDESGGFSRLEICRRIAVSDNGAHILAAGIAADVMDGDYANTFFSVTPTQAASSGLRTYDADGGLASAGIFVNHVWKISPRFGAFIRVTLNQLQGDAAASPITRSRNYGTGLLSFAYRF